MTKVILDRILYWGCFVVALFPVTTCPGATLQPAGARSLAMSGASVSFSDAWSSFNNQAGIAGVNRPAGGVYFESRFGIDELSLAAGTAIVPVGKGSFAASASQFGKGAFRENKFGLAYAHTLTEKWYAGIQFDYFTQLLPENGESFGFYTFEGGVLFHASESLHLGAHVFNPVSEGFSMPEGKQKMPFIVKTGGNYSFDKSVLVAFEVEKDDLNPLVLKSGVEFMPADNFVLRLGFSGKPIRYTAGFGYNTGGFSADLGFSYHGNLGLTPAVSVQFHLP